MPCLAQASANALQVGSPESRDWSCPTNQASAISRCSVPVDFLSRLLYARPSSVPSSLALSGARFLMYLETACVSWVSVRCTKYKCSAVLVGNVKGEG